MTSELGILEGDAVSYARRFRWFCEHGVQPYQASCLSRAEEWLDARTWHHCSAPTEGEWVRVEQKDYGFCAFLEVQAWVEERWVTVAAEVSPATESEVRILVAFLIYDLTPSLSA